MSKFKTKAHYPNSIAVVPAEVIGDALDGARMLLIIIDNTPVAIPYELAYELAKTIRRIVKAKPDGKT